MYAWVILKHMHCIHMFEFVSVTSSFQVTMTNTLKMYIQNLLADYCEILKPYCNFIK